MSALSPPVVSIPGFLGGTSIIAPNPPPTTPVIWITETISYTNPPQVPVIWITETVSHIVAVQSTPPIPIESLILSAVRPLASPPHPLAIIPITSLPHLTPIQATSTIPTTTELLTVTETLTVTLPAPLTAPPLSLTSTSTLRVPKSIWRAPARMADLSAFNISAFSGGRKNLKIVPLSAIDSDLLSDSSGSSDPSTTRGDSGSVLQLFYPAGSINPAQRPVGGAQFYATPLDLAGARNVTLQYSVFFPTDFHWVLGGKLPGLYGGRAGCSGGNKALDCFSTRLMWRKYGKGELYLYAPKDEQTEDLCSDPQSVCDAAYGFSIGRGSFRWARGAWTTVRQTVTLNTPGKQDGSFTLDVNDERVIERNDIFYRSVPLREVHTVIPDKKHSGIGGLLGTLLSDLLRRSPETTAAGPTPTIAEPGGDADAALVALETMYQAQREWAVQVLPPSAAPTDTKSQISPAYTQQPTTSPFLRPLGQQAIEIETEGRPVGFIGLFFSTFFGGHDYRYATPKDQYVWFKDFAMSYNA